MKKFQFKLRTLLYIVLGIGAFLAAGIISNECSMDNLKDFTVQHYVYPFAGSKICYDNGISDTACFERCGIKIKPMPDDRTDAYPCVSLKSSAAIPFLCSVDWGATRGALIGEGGKVIGLTFFGIIIIKYQVVTWVS